MEILLKKMQQLLEKGDSIAYSEADLKFYEVIAESCQNQRLIKMRRNISDQTQRYRISSLIVPKSLRESFNEHQKIFQAFEERNPKKAERMSQKHIQDALKNILKRVIKKDDN